MVGRVVYGCTNSICYVLIMCLFLLRNFDDVTDTDNVFLTCGQFHQIVDGKIAVGDLFLVKLASGKGRKWPNKFGCALICMRL